MTNTVPAFDHLHSTGIGGVWPAEPYNFTLWSAPFENLELCPESLELTDLDSIKPEHNAGTFSADMGVHFRDSEHHVLLAGSLERAHHPHVAFAGPVEWSRNHQGVVKRASIKTAVANPNDRADKQRQRGWMLDRLQWFERMFGPVVVKALTEFDPEASAA